MLEHTIINYITSCFERQQQSGLYRLSRSSNIASEHVEALDVYRTGHTSFYSSCSAANFTFHHCLVLKNEIAAACQRVQNDPKLENLDDQSIIYSNNQPVIMAKRSQKRPVRHERDQSGCMWGFISMLDFRHGRSTQKLLADKRRGGRPIAGAQNADNHLQMSKNSDENFQGAHDGEENTTTDPRKPSVKKLIEEEMFNEQDASKEGNDAEEETKQADSEHERLKKKNKRRRSRGRSKSCDIKDVDAAESGWPSHQNGEKRSTNSLDLEKIMQEVCSQIYQKKINCIKHDKQGENYEQLNLKSPEFEEKLTEAIKLCISQRLVNGRDATEDGDPNSFKELRDALQSLSSDEELCLKLFQGPNSIISKYMQNLWNVQAEKDEESKSLAESKLLERELHDLRQSGELIQGKHHKFFRRRSKSMDKILSKGDNVSQPSNRIVILKPGPTGLPISETDCSLGTSPESHFIIPPKGHNERVGSHFFLAEIKRKLKNAMGKERQENSGDRTSRFTKEKRTKVECDKGFKGNAGRKSSGKDHFYIEKIARPATGVRMGDKTGKLKESEINVEHDTANYPLQRVSNIYTEAKKHLSEMLTNGTADMDLTSGQNPKTLGRILSLPEYNFSPIGSPGRDLGQGFVTAQKRYSAHGKLQEEEDNVSHPGQTMLNLEETQTCVPNDNTENTAQAGSDENSSPFNDHPEDKEVEKTVGSIGGETTSEGDVEIVEATEIIDQEEIDQESNISDTQLESTSLPATGDDQNAETGEVFDEKGGSECLKQNSCEDTKNSSSPLWSPSSSTIKKFEDREGASEIPERPSPVSVLEPLFMEEDISPASTRSQAVSVELLIQPVRIQFQEGDNPDADQGIHLKTATGNKDSIFEYVKAVLQASGMNWDEFYIRLHSSDQLLDSSVFDEVEFFANELYCDENLLFDCVNEVLGEACGRYLGFLPGLSFVKPTIRPLPDMKNFISEIWEGVHWHLLPLPLPHTLDQLVKKDMAKTGTWMDLRCDAEFITVEVGEAIFEDLMEEILVSCVNESSGGENHSLEAELEIKE